MTKKLNKKSVEKILKDMLNDCLESYNQGYSFQVTKVDLEKMKFSVDFNIVVVEEDNYVGFTGY